jgi:hypothetical protein
MSPRKPAPPPTLADVTGRLPGWRERWIVALRAFGWAVPAPRGRTVRLRLGKDGVAATVRAGGPPQLVSFRLAPVPPRTFDAAMRRLASRAAAAASGRWSSSFPRRSVPGGGTARIRAPW